jgi:CRISPR system Cascade subunit CasD
MRDTLLEPSKSGVIGLLCAALGRPRSHPLEDLSQLRLGVRVDREGVLKMDYHTAGGVHRQGEEYGVALADGSGTRTVTSQRYYLADADFLVGLEAVDESSLRALDQALSRPRWPLYLGRKAFVPGAPVRVGFRPPHLPGPKDVPGIIHLPLEETLRRYAFLCRSPREKTMILQALQAGQSIPLRLVLEAEPGETAEVRPDQPLSFAERHFSQRYVRTDYQELTPDLIQEESHVPLPSPA